MVDDLAVFKTSLTADGFEAFERIAEGNESVLDSLQCADGVESVFRLRTCERYELYAIGPTAEARLRERTTAVPSGSIETGEAAVTHLFRVACGLESSVLGEDQIIGQVRDAYASAVESGTVTGRLDTIVLKALRAGERARTETAINEGHLSLGSIALDRAREELPDRDPTEWSVLVIGAGEVASLVIRALDRREVPDIVVANRTRSRGETIAEKVGGEAISLASIPDRFPETDILVSATGAAEPIIAEEDLRGQDLVAIDLANPPDVGTDGDTLQGVQVVRIDEILASQRLGEAVRRDAIPRVNEIMDEELERLEGQLRAEEVDETIRELYERAEALRQREFREAVERLEAAGESLTPEQTAVIEDFSQSLVKSLLHPKTAALRQAAATGDQAAVNAWLRLYSDAHAIEHEEPELANQPN